MGYGKANFTVILTTGSDGVAVMTEAIHIVRLDVDHLLERVIAP